MSTMISKLNVKMLALNEVRIKYGMKKAEIDR